MIRQFLLHMVFVCGFLIVINSISSPSSITAKESKNIATASYPNTENISDFIDHCSSIKTIITELIQSSPLLQLKTSQKIVLNNDRTMAITLTPNASNHLNKTMKSNLDLDKQMGVKNQLALLVISCLNETNGQIKYFP